MSNDVVRLCEYVVSHTIRGECQCGKCIDKQPDREAPAHSRDVHFFWVSAINDPSAAEFYRLIIEHYPSAGRLKDGPSYIEIGGELGSQEIALRFIGLGGILGLWPIWTPRALKVTGLEANSLGEGGFVMCGGLEEPKAA